jgi:hypothetical protein
MIIGVDFDGVIVAAGQPDPDVPLVLLPGSLEGLQALKRAGHKLVLISARANRAVREDWRLNPMWVSGVVPFDEARWVREKERNQRRYHQMLEFVLLELPGIFDAIDDGGQGKVTGVRLMIDDWAHRFVEGDWRILSHLYGEPPDDQTDPRQEVRSGT